MKNPTSGHLAKKSKKNRVAISRLADTIFSSLWS